MNNNIYKSIISALAGAAIVLVCTLIVLEFIKKDGPELQVTNNEEVKAVVRESPVIKDVSSKEIHKETPQAEIEFPNTVEEMSQSDAGKTVNAKEPEQELSGESKELDLAPIMELFESNTEVSKLDDQIAERKSEFKKPEIDNQGLPLAEPVQKTVPENKVASKTLTPEGKELLPVTQIDLSPKSTLEILLNENDDFLKISSKNFDAKWLKLTGALWTDNLKSSARSIETLKFGSVSSGETIFTFRNKFLSKISMMVYNKGDDDLISENRFNSIKKEALNALEVHIGKKPLFKPNAGVAKNNIYFWVHNNHLYKLEYGTSKQGKIFIGEYIRIVVTRGSNRINVINIDRASNDVLTEAELRAMVSRNDGDVLINGIPMVDQGAKGYCACAALARLMTYFGRDIDQHDIAKLAGSTADNGTEPDKLKKAIESMSAKLRLNMKVLAKPYLSNERDASRLEKKLGMLVAKMEDSDLQSVYNRFAYEDRRYKEFEKNVMNSIDRGRPVSWALSLGIVPEPEIPQVSGGHMRIITGYNRLKKVIYYTDTWGAGHEKKSMDMATAFYISLAVWEISPR